MKKIFILMSILLLSSCFGGDKDESNSSETSVNSENTAVDNIENSEPELPAYDSYLGYELKYKAEEGEERYQFKNPENGDLFAVFHTNLGEFVIKLFPDEAPLAVSNLVGLAEKDYYAGVKFHRNIRNFMIQGGDPTGTGSGGESVFGQNFRDEFSENLKNLPGALSMANSGPSTNGSQFFIIHNSPQKHLDGVHTVYGQVLEGMDIFDKIFVEKEGEEGIFDENEIKMIGVEIFELQDRKLAETKYSWKEVSEEIFSNTKVLENSVISVEYNMYLDDEEAPFRSSETLGNLDIHMTLSDFPDKLRQELLGKVVGDEVNLTLEPKDAYGVRNNNDVFQVTKAQFIKKFTDLGEKNPYTKEQISEYFDGLVEGGMASYGAELKVVSKKYNNSVVLDNNHPLAGKKVKYELKIVTIK